MKLVDPPERKILNEADPHVMGNNLIHCVADTQMKEM